MSYIIGFDKKAFEDYKKWASSDLKIFIRIGEIIESLQRDPFHGIGKPEPLKHDLKGFWSRRITDEHRLVYQVSGGMILIVSCKEHYQK